MKRSGLWGPRWSRRTIWAAASIAAVLVLPLAAPTNSASAVAPALRSGNMPIVHSVTIDAQRRLVVTYTALDGMTYGGKVYLGNDPRNAVPVSPHPGYGFMYCANNSTCQGRWTLNEVTPDTGPFTFTSPPLNAQEFPPGQYWVQVITKNEDPYPSTRYEQPSNIKSLPIPAGAGGGGDGGGGAAPTDATPNFESLLVDVGQRPGERTRLSVGVTCPNTRYYSAHVVLETPSGRQFWAGVVAQGKIQQNSDRGFQWTGSKYYRLKGGTLRGRPFVLKVWNVVCWADDDTEPVGPKRRVFSTLCRGPGTIDLYPDPSPCKIDYDTPGRV